jgi:PAS domain S-box-containing protein
MKPLILIIDDEESIRFAFQKHLSKEGYAVLTAESYDLALEAISNTDFDVIFADIILPGHSGIDILREVKNKGLPCPVVIITGKPNIDTSAEAVRSGAFDYLTKPIRKETLLRVTHRAWNHKSLMDEKERIETEKERYRHNLKAIFGSLKDAVITVDAEMRVIEANESTRSICGLSPQEITGEIFPELLNRCHKLCHDIISKTLKTQNTIMEYRVECGHQDRPGQIVLLTCSPLIDGDNFMGAVLVVRDITRLSNLERELQERSQFHHIVGKSVKMQEIYNLLEDLADTETTVLITGESGTGKDLVARALHYGGIRAGKALVKVNCSALAENLLESELFGHVKGAFTSAVRDKIGRFQLADGGTIFLDEIGDISPRIQLKLLRVLEDKKFEKVGDSNPIEVNVRVIAVTNCDLRERVSMGEFREDLYYRLKVIEIALPTLRQKREDIPLLVDHFFDLFNKSFKKNILSISDEVSNKFMDYPWPGNVRELEHAMEHAFVLCRGRTIEMDHLPPDIKEYSTVRSYEKKGKAVDERQKTLQALNDTDWNKAKTARQLGISRPTLYQKIKQFKLTKPTNSN